MRNPERIRRVMNVLTAIWLTCPDIRFNQLIHNLSFEYANENKGYKNTYFEQEQWQGFSTFRPVETVDLFNLEDEDFLKFLQKKLDEYEK